MLFLRENWNDIQEWMLQEGIFQHDVKKELSYSPNCPKAKCVFLENSEVSSLEVFNLAGILARIFKNQRLMLFHLSIVYKGINI